MKLTQKVAKEYIRLLGGRLIRDTEWDEYRVKFGEEVYHCSDLDDAIGTACAMKSSADAFEAAEEYLTLMTK